MAAPRKKPPVKKKKAPVKKPPKKAPAKKPDVKSPAETRKSISRKQVGTQRPARGGVSGARAQALEGPKKPGTSLTVTNRGSLTTPNTRSVAKTGEQVAQNARNAITRTAKNAVGFAEKWIPNAIKPKGGGMGLVNKLGGPTLAVTSIVNPDFMNFKTEKTKAGELEAAKPSSSLMGGRKLTDKENAANAFRKKPSGTYFPTAKNKSSGEAPFSKGKGSAAKPKAPTGSGNPVPGANYSGQGTASGNDLRRAGAGTYFPTTKKSGSSGAFTLGSGAQTQDNVKGKKTGTSQAQSVVNAGGGGSAAAKRGMSRPQTKNQRESLAMEQRKTPSGNPKKSILSLFRKRK